MSTYSLTDLALRHGSLLRDTVVPARMSLAGWYRAHTSGRLVRLHPGVSRLACTAPTPIMGVEAALAAAMPGSTVAGLTAAWLWGAPSAAHGTIELIAPPYRHPGHLEGVEFHRPTDSASPRVCTVQGLRVCEPLRAILDVAAWHPDRVDRVLADLQRIGCVDMPAVHDMLRRERRQGRPGVTALESALSRWDKRHDLQISPAVTPISRLAAV